MKQFLLKTLFFTSKQPVLFRDLLEANTLFNEGMHIDGSKLNFKFNYPRIYLAYALFCLFWFLLAMLAFHTLLAKADSHISIIITAVLTALGCMGFDLFKLYLRRQKALELIKKAWEVHFPYFAYDKYNEKVELIYGEALKKEVAKKDLEKFVLDALVLSSVQGAQKGKS